MEIPGPEDAFPPQPQKIYTVARENVGDDEVVNRVMEIRRQSFEGNVFGSNVKFPPPVRPLILETTSYDFPVGVEN
jgi:hypothetical protein